MSYNNLFLNDTHGNFTKDCYHNTDAYFACLDSKGYATTTNPDSCPQEFENWKATCPNTIRKAELLKRYADYKIDFYMRKKALNE